MERNDFLLLIKRAFEREALSRLVFSRPTCEGARKVTGRLVSHRGRRLLAVEYTLADTVSQKNVAEGELCSFLEPLFNTFRQVNLYTPLGDAEYKVNKRGEAVYLGADKLLRKLSGETPAFEKAIEALDRRKNYILGGDEPFLITLGISDKSGRVHDKKQGKFRQINRFLEHLEGVYRQLPTEGTLTVFDLCCGKSYLSFAVYHYLTVIKGRRVDMLGVDLKADVIRFCEGVARELHYDGMRFESGDITALVPKATPDLVVSLHACDVATDIVLDTAIKHGARVILSTPCCHRYLNDRLSAPALDFVTESPHLTGKLCEVLTDGIRLARLSANGYEASAVELTDPENTPKNTLLIAIRRGGVNEEKMKRYQGILDYLLGDGKESYLDFLK